MDYKKIIIDGYRESATTHIIDENGERLPLSRRMDYFVRMAEDATAKGITSEKFFHECKNALKGYDDELFRVFAQKLIEFETEIEKIAKLEQSTENICKLEQLEKARNELTKKGYKASAFQVDDNGERTKKKCHTIDESVLAKLENDLEMAKKWLQQRNETNKKPKSKGGKQHTPFSQRLRQDVMEKVRELINESNDSGKHVAKVLEALQHKGYITTNSYSIPQVIAEFGIECKKQSISKYLDKGKFYINPTRPESGFTNEFQQMIDRLP